jgi:hypothetical protein
MKRLRPLSLAASHWPTQANASAFYGNPNGAHGLADPAWIKKNLILVPVPYRMVVSWTPDRVMTHILFHRKCADALQRVLNGILAHFGSQAAIDASRMNMYSGAYMYRLKRGQHSLSMHAYGCAIDLDAEHNAFGSHAWTMPASVVALFDAEGATWGGRWGYPDAMHFQFANVT